MEVKIFRPAKSSTQSGLAGKKDWVIEFEIPPAGQPDILMGWAQGSNQYSRLSLKFPTCERAITFAKKHDWNYTVLPENFRCVKPSSFADNFKCEHKQ